MKISKGIGLTEVEKAFVKLVNNKIYILDEDGKCFHSIYKNI